MSSSAESPGRALVQRTFDEWPPELRALFDGEGLASKIGFTASLITVGIDGHLRTSLLGIGELYAPDERSIAFALWPGSRAARTLSTPAREREPLPEAGQGHRHAHAAMTFVHDGAFHQVQLEVEPLRLPGAGNEPGCGLALFIASIEAGEAQQVGYARLTNGIAFELLSGQHSEQRAVLDRWERQIDRLREAANLRQTSGGRSAASG
jgi:hypothetical protein